MAAPVVARVLRGDIAEVIHRGHAALVSPDGTLRHSLGDADARTTIRSAAKPFFALPVITSGAADAFDLDERELALLCASHAGGQETVDILDALARRAGIDAAELACGESEPADPAERDAVIRGERQLTAFHHECSGAHLAPLLVARHAGWRSEGYTAVDHPAQVAARDALARASGTDAAAWSTAVDDCALPTYALPLTGIARAYASIAEPAAAAARGLDGPMVAGLARLRSAMLRHPELVDGRTGTVDTDLPRATQGIAAKHGAEGTQCLAIGGIGASSSLGLAVTIEDGDQTERATKALVLAMLDALGIPLDADVLPDGFEPILSAPDGRAIGRVEALLPGGWPAS